MAANRFEAHKVSVSPNSEGHGGVIRVNTHEDTFTQVALTAWWNPSGLTGADKIQQRAVYDFILLQGNGPDGFGNYRTPVHILASDGQQFVMLVASHRSTTIGIQTGAFQLT